MESLYRIGNIIIPLAVIGAVIYACTTVTNVFDSPAVITGSSLFLSIAIGWILMR